MDKQKLQQQPQSMVTFSDPNEKDYLVLILGYEGDKEFRDFEWVTGRKEVYEFIKGLIVGGTTDIQRSQVIAEGQPIEKALSFLKYMKDVIDLGLVDDPGFDIMDYFIGDQEEE